MTQEHSFITYIRNKHSFELTIFGLTVSASWSINFKQYFRTTIASPLLSIKFVFTNIIPKTAITFINSLIKLIINLNSNIIITKPSIVFTMSQWLKITSPITISKLLLTLIMNVIYKLDPITLKIPKINIVADFIQAKFYKLWEHDGKTLSTMDSETLQDLDYTIT